MKLKAREAALAIATLLNDSSKVEELLGIFEERKKPLDYRITGVQSLFTGIGLYLFGIVAIEAVLEGVGLLVGTIL